MTLLPPEELQSRAQLSSDRCVIDRQHFFVRACLEIPVIDEVDPFIWGVWVSLSQQNFERMSELWETEGRELEPPYFGWLSSPLPCYPDTLNLRTLVHTRPVGQRPYIELEVTDHPLALEQHNAITMDRVQKLAECFLHSASE